MNAAMLRINSIEPPRAILLISTLEDSHNVDIQTYINVQQVRSVNGDLMNLKTAVVKLNQLVSAICL
ncbi:hypothetical protein GCM10007978_24400 [Shewanella hanedai]|nr:hypothetical protein GCM10007978_24400 [Shewanella hanedai]